MEDQAIPAIAVSVIWCLNYLFKRRFFCISNLVLLYVSLSYWGAVPLHLEPRTGYPFSDHDAMVFLAWNSVLFCLPALFYNDCSNNLVRPMNQIPSPVLKMMAYILICITLPGSIYFFCRGVPNLAQFIRGGVDRDVFRGANMMATGWDSPLVFLFRLGNCFELTATFLGLALLVTKRFGKMLPALLLFGGAGFCFDSLGTISRSILFYKCAYILIVFLLFFSQMERKDRKKLLSLLMMVGGILLIPFLLISLRRFDDDFLYSTLSYFSVGPYGFNVDYFIKVTYDLRDANGVLTMGFFTYIYQALTSTTVYQDGFNLIGAFNGEGNGALSALYRYISGAYCGEFKTAIGSLLIDYSTTGVVIFSSVFSCIYTFYFWLKRNSFAKLFMSSIYFFILTLLPMGWAFPMRNENMQLLISLIFVVVMMFYEKKPETELDIQNVEQKQ